MTSATMLCANCDAEFEVEAEVWFTTERHPYGSTTAAEHLVEVDGDPTPDACPDCGQPYDIDKALDRIIEAADTERWEA